MSNFYILGAMLLLLCSGSVVANRKCTEQGGNCVPSVRNCDFPKQPVKNLCNGQKKCCLLDEDAKCTQQGGICQEITEKCGRSYVKFLCGGGSSRRCCLPNAAAPCTAKGGKCLETGETCRGKKVVGLCGYNKIECCIPRKCDGHKRSKYRNKGYSPYQCGSDTCCKIPGFHQMP
ncbi:helofensin-1-like [Saccostrea cucullata]|uniref:helofensin-1-like n=1 Tax=Saccostrea cuccullata TaxID=36930 RepID=UPI002ED51876